MYEQVKKPTSSWSPQIQQKSSKFRSQPFKGEHPQEQRQESKEVPAYKPLPVDWMTDNPIMRMLDTTPPQEELEGQDNAQLTARSEKIQHQGELASPIDWVANHPLMRSLEVTPPQFQPTTSVQRGAELGIIQPLSNECQGNTIQRDIENETYNDINPTNITAAKLFFQAYNEAVQKAYTYATTVPSLGVYENLNGYTQLWVKKWNEHLSGGRPNLMAATFGYVIESLVSEPTSEFCPKLSGGYSVDVQVTSGGTRPDLVLRLTKGTAHIAWLDLTASASADHIYLKDDWPSKVGNFAEVTYPSLDPAILAFMKQNKDNKGAISEEEFKLKLAKAKEEYQVQKKQWLKIGRQFLYSNLVNEVTARDKITKKTRKVPKELQRLNPAIPREFIRKQLDKYFDTEEPIQEKMVPSILKAMGVNPTTWGYTTGYNVSEKAGEAWLIDNPVTLDDD